jgi:hypothetical protein
VQPSGTQLTATQLPDAREVLANAVPRAQLSGLAGKSVSFVVPAVPAGRTLTVTLSGGLGDASLLVGDCRSESFATNQESCAVAGADAEVTVTVTGVKDFAGATLTASF